MNTVTSFAMYLENLLKVFQFVEFIYFLHFSHFLEYEINESIWRLDGHQNTHQIYHKILNVIYLVIINNLVSNILALKLEHFEHLHTELFI